MAQGMSSKEKARRVRQSGLPENRSNRDRQALRENGTKCTRDEWKTIEGYRNAD